jgi:hypothetical protein
MKQWLKDNWFKLGVFAILLVVGISATRYYLYILPQAKNKNTKFVSGQISAKEDLELQAMCAKKSEEVFKVEYPRLIKDETYDYACHYDKKLKKCFMKVTHVLIDTSQHIIDTNDNLFDAYEHKTYAEYHQVRDNGQDYPESACECLGQRCNSKAEYDALVKPYMEE